MMNNNKNEGESSSGSTLILTVVILGLLIAFQQWNSKECKPPIEQPIGLVGIAEYMFRHPEALFGL